MKIVLGDELGLGPSLRDRVRQDLDNGMANDYHDPDATDFAVACEIVDCTDLLYTYPDEFGDLDAVTAATKIEPIVAEWREEHR